MLSELDGEIISGDWIPCLFGHGFAFSMVRLPATCCPIGTA